MRANLLPLWEKVSPKATDEGCMTPTSDRRVSGPSPLASLTPYGKHWSQRPLTRMRGRSRFGAARPVGFADTLSHKGRGLPRVTYFPSTCSAQLGAFSSPFKNGITVFANSGVRNIS